jgi:hypothetical protein
MLLRVLVCLALLTAVRAWSQAAQDPSQMQTPPIVSGGDYPSQAESEERSNFLSAGVHFTAAYDDNVVGAGISKPVSDVTLMVNPSIALNQTTPRQKATLAYNPGFTFYLPTSQLNESNEAVSGSYLYRLAPHANVTATESFFKTAGVFSQSDALSGGVVSGSPTPSPVVAPYADQLSNITNGGISYQYSLNGMLGGGGVYDKSSFPNQAESVGLSNSSSEGGSAFWSQRLTQKQYIGLKYQYLRGLTSLKTDQIEVQTHAFDPFYAVYFNRTFSVSLSAGPEYASASGSTSAAAVKSWGPSATVGVGVQGERVNFAASFLRAVAGGTGLQGEFQTTRGNASLRLKASEKWTASVQGVYQILKDAAPELTVNSGGGHTASGGVAFSRTIGREFAIDFGYNRIHQSYAGVASIENAPNNNHEYVSISYLITRPLGR